MYTNDYAPTPFWLSQTKQMLPIASIVKPLTAKQTVKATDQDASFFRRIERDHRILLNHQQIAAIRHIDGPLLIMAGAGSGKTTCISAKVAYLADVGRIPINRILAVTFTKKAANELSERIAAMVGERAFQVNACTFHSFFWRFLKQNGYSKHQIIANETSRRAIMASIINKLGLAKRYTAEEALDAVQLGHTATERNLSTNEDGIQCIVEAYQRYLEESRLLDFDTLQIKTNELLRNNPHLMSKMQQAFDYILIDEFQDVNPIQADIIRLLVEPRNNLCAVGDPRQTIYGFRGSDVRNINQFADDYPGAVTIRLDINYRSTNSIVGLANRILVNTPYSEPLYVVKGSKQVPLFLGATTIEQEADVVQRTIMTEVGNGSLYCDIAVLYRSTSACRKLVEKLLINDIPIIIANGQPLIYNDPSIKPIIAILRLAVEPANMALLANVLPVWYVSPLKAVPHLERLQRLYPKNLLAEHLLAMPGLQPFHYESLGRWIKVLGRLPDCCPVTAIQLIRETGYDYYLGISKHHNDTSFKSQQALTLLEELQEAVSQYGSITALLMHIDELIVRFNAMRQLEQNASPNALRLLTIHSAKGLEFNTVFIIGCCDGIMPHSRIKDTSALSSSAVLEEERRLLYVAITRAKEKLYISCPSQVNNTSTQASCFLREAFSISTPIESEVKLG